MIYEFFIIIFGAFLVTIVALLLKFAYEYIFNEGDEIQVTELFWKGVYLGCFTGLLLDTILHNMST